jgi:hypothetical protein
MPKKVALKKVTAKKVISKKTVIKKKEKEARPLVYADNARSFWLFDGQVLNSLVALKEALSSMQKDVFSHHVTKEKNDFADWVELVLADVETASLLRKAKTAKTAHASLMKRLKEYDVS